LQAGAEVLRFMLSVADLPGIFLLGVGFVKKKKYRRLTALKSDGDGFELNSLLPFGIAPLPRYCNIHFKRFWRM